MVQPVIVIFHVENNPRSHKYGIEITEAVCEYLTGHMPRVISTMRSKLSKTFMKLALDLGLLVKSVRLIAGKLSFDFRSGLTKDLKNGIRSFLLYELGKSRKYGGISLCEVGARLSRMSRFVS